MSQAWQSHPKAGSNSLLIGEDYGAPFGRYFFFFFFFDSCALASPEFEGREGEELGSHLAHELLKAYSNDGCLDLGSLAVIPGQQCWVLYVDALVPPPVAMVIACFNYFFCNKVLEWGGGGVLESLSVAVFAALRVTRYIT